MSLHKEEQGGQPQARGCSPFQPQVGSMVWGRHLGSLHIILPCSEVKGEKPFVCMTSLSLGDPRGSLLNHSGRFLVERPMHMGKVLHPEAMQGLYPRTLSWDREQDTLYQELLPVPLGCQRASGFQALLGFPAPSLLHQPAPFFFSQSDKCMLPSKAEGKEKIEMRSPSCILPRNATNLAFRLFAPLIRRPLRNLCRVFVHSFSLMKHQISFTNNSCVTSKQSGPSQGSCSLQ